MIDVLPSEAITARIIEDVAEWDVIRHDWDSLHAASPTASSMLDFCWLRCWWQIYGPVYGAGGLRIITLWREAQLVGALPLYIDNRRGSPYAAQCLRFVSTGEEEYEETCPDYLNLLHLPGEEMACTHAAWVAVDTLHWDTLEFIDIPVDSPLLRWRAAFSGNERLKIVPRGSCPIAVIGDGFEAYLTRLSSKTRMRARQEMRKVARSGAMFELATRENVDSYFDDLIRIHQKRWIADGKPGCFSSPRFTEFNRLLVSEWAASGRLVLARLSYRGVAHVVLYGFVTKGKFDLYQLGVEPIEGVAIHSPGIAANLLLMAQLAEMGVAHYDFLRGTSPYKKSLTTEQRDVVCLTCRKPTARALFDQAMQLLMRVVRKMGRLASRH